MFDRVKGWMLKHNVVQGNSRRIPTDAIYVQEIPESAVRVGGKIDENGKFYMTKMMKCPEHLKGKIVTCIIFEEE